MTFCQPKDMCKSFACFDSLGNIICALNSLILHFMFLMQFIFCDFVNLFQLLNKAKLSDLNFLTKGFLFCLYELAIFYI